MGYCWLILETVWALGYHLYNSSNFVASIIAACTSIAAQQLELLNDLQWQDSYIISL